MSWDSNAQRKIVLIGDAPGHPNTKVAPFQTTDEIMESLKKDGVEVVVYPVIVPK
jgi:hypothetical protein